MADGIQHEADSTADELPEYMRAIEAHRDHPVVERWFHQITQCQLVIPRQGRAAFTMIEFRDGRMGAMVWNDGNGNWGTGGWLPLSADDLLSIDIGYLQDAPAARSFAGVLDMVAARRQDAPPAPPPGRRWWPFRSRGGRA